MITAYVVAHMGLWATSDGMQETAIPKSGLKIKLNMGAAKSKAGANVNLTPGDTPPFAMPRTKRNHKRRAVGGYDHSSFACL